MRNVGKIRKKINLPCPVSYDEPMSRHSSFRIGGPADLYVTPQSTEQAALVYGQLNERGIPTFILGAGAIPAGIGLMGDAGSFSLGIGLVGVLILLGSILCLRLRI